MEEKQNTSCNKPQNDKYKVMQNLKINCMKMRRERLHSRQEIVCDCITF